MENLKTLSNEMLLLNTKDLAARERELTTKVLWHLREIEARRLFAKLAYASLFEYAVKELGYSEASAMRRINAMRLLKEIPQAEEALAAGKLNLSHLSAAQSFFRGEQKHEGKTYTKEEKLDLLSSLEGTSQRQTEKMLVALSPETVLRTQERIKPVNETHSEFKTIISSDLLKKLERVRELSSHKTKSGNWAEVLELMADQVLAAHDATLAKKPQRRAPAVPKLERRAPHSTPAPAGPTPEVKRSGRYIPRALKRALFEKAQGQCEYQDPSSGRRCDCRSYLQVDHITPLALGGETSAQNLRVLCHAHNQWAALQTLGKEKMQRYWRSASH